MVGVGGAGPRAGGAVGAGAGAGRDATQDSKLAKATAYVCAAAVACRSTESGEDGELQEANTHQGPPPQR